MDSIYNYLYPDYYKDRQFVNIFLIPKIEEKIKNLESIIKDKTEYSSDIKEAIKAKKIILLTLRYYYKI
jgi:hypothetical protein